MDGEFLNKILLGDCLEVLKKLPDASVDSIVTDPPYGLGTKEPTVEEIVAYLSEESGLDTGGDFMGRDWSVPSVATWKECFRVLKPGGHLLSFGGTRTFDLMSMGIRAAGFRCRDTVASEFGVQVLQWIHGQGFAKGSNIVLGIDKKNGGGNRGRAIPTASTYQACDKKRENKLTSNPVGEYKARTEAAKQWQGWHTNLKPSWEPILVFRKPLEEKTVAEQVLKTGTGGLNIDACRVKCESNPSILRRETARRTGTVTISGKSAAESTKEGRIDRRGSAEAYMSVHEGEAKGRWPANLIFTHTPDCKIVGYKKVPAPVINRWTDGAKPFGNGAGHPFESEQMGDAEGKGEIPIYECEDGCPVKELDEQSGILKSGAFDQASKKAENRIYGKHERYKNPKQYAASSGGASRFFGQIRPEAPFQYVAKASRKEKNLGLLPGEQNKHPTVKPLKLAEWLVRLVTPKGGVTLDPFCGSGTICIAAVRCGCNYIGIDKDRESCATAVQRIAGGVVGVGRPRKKKAVPRKGERSGKKQRQLKLGLG